MELMGIRNTQFILVRHHNTDNPHCHLVYNRIGYDGKVISSQGDHKRNEIATKLLKNKYGLTYAEDKGKTNVEKLHASERVKYEIFNAVKAALKYSKTWKEFNDYLLRRGIRLEFVKRTREIKRPEDIQGIRFTKDGQTFKASHKGYRTEVIFSKVRDRDCSARQAAPLPKSRYLRKNSCADAGKRDKKGKVSDCSPSFPIQIIHEH